MSAKSAWEPVEYSATWPRAFSQEALRLGRAFGWDVSLFHHVGSTSVPGLCAKPIIDILAESENVALIPNFIEPMKQLCYEFLGENGIPGRFYFERETGLVGEPAFHLHIFQAGSGQVRRHLLFRDYLRTFPAEANRYAELKWELARRYPGNRQAYQDGKAALVSAMERAALQHFAI